jgi:pyridoxal phosphate enzyme (YggS family)
MTENKRIDEVSHALTQVEKRIAQACLLAGRTRDDVTLIAVTKTYPVSDVLILQHLGIKNFGENRDAEGVEKFSVTKASPLEAQWHYQGEIQSKKIASITTWADTVHSLDDLSHIQKFDRALEARGDKSLQVFIQVSLDGNPTRSGLMASDLMQACNAVTNSSHLTLMGVMTVPPVESDPEKSFAEIAAIAEVVRSDFPEARYLSAGMSGDFEVAIAYGATHIRIGSQILGSRSTAP